MDIDNSFYMNANLPTFYFSFSTLVTFLDIYLRPALWSDSIL